MQSPRAHVGEQGACYPVNPMATGSLYASNDAAAEPTTTLQSKAGGGHGSCASAAAGLGAPLERANSNEGRPRHASPGQQGTRHPSAAPSPSCTQNPASEHCAK